MQEIADEVDKPAHSPHLLANALESILKSRRSLFTTVVETVQTLMNIPSQNSQKWNEISVKLCEQMDIMEKALFNFEAKVERVSEIKAFDRNIQFEFNFNLAKLHNLKSTFDRYLRIPNEHTKEDFINECESNPGLYFTQYVRMEMSREGELSLKEFMIHKNNLKWFGSWSKIIVQTFINAMIIHGYCLGARINDDSTMDEVKAHDMQGFKETLTKLEHFIRLNTKQIKKNYNEFLGEEVDAYAMNHQDQNHVDFCFGLYRVLNPKYSYRLFHIISYDGNTDGDEFQGYTMGPHVYVSLNKFNRSVYVMSTNNDEKIQESFEECVKDRQNNGWFGSATNVSNDLQKCCSKLNGLLVVKNTLDNFSIYQSGTYVTIKGTVSWDQSKKYDYTAFAVPQEIDDY